MLATSATPNLKNNQTNTNDFLLGTLIPSVDEDGIVQLGAWVTLCLLTSHHGSVQADSELHSASSCENRDSTCNAARLKSTSVGGIMSCNSEEGQIRPSQP